MPRSYPCDEFFDLAGFAHASLLSDVANVWEVLGDKLERYLKDRLRPGVCGPVEDGAYLIGDEIEIGEGTVVEAGAYIRGPVIIGKNCEVRHGAYIRGQALVGDDCVVGHTTEVKGSIFLDGAK